MPKNQPKRREIGRQLRNPPLIEAVCEFRFDPRSPWDWTIPGRLFDKIGHEFSERHEIRPTISIAIDQAQGGPVPPQMATPAPVRLQLRRPDGTATVQLAPHVLGIIQNPPYRSWETFRDLVLNINKTYLGIAGLHEITRLGMRYINRIALDGPDPNSIITTWPNFPANLQRRIALFLQRYELEYDHPEGVLVHQTGIQAAEEQRFVMLDLDFFSQVQRHAMPPPSDWLESAHRRIEEAFIDSLQPDIYDKLLGE
jgi:uncharacterized protein (TIGR04255 family)